MSQLKFIIIIGLKPDIPQLGKNITIWIYRNFDKFIKNMLFIKCSNISIERIQREEK